MREDMSRVIVERPRIIESIARKGRVRDLEDLLVQQGMRRGQRERGGWKMLNENLAPLRRFLERQVGRPWDKVYSEIAARLRVDSTVQQHVRDHLRDFVETRPRRGTYRWSGHNGEGLWFQRLYVDPRDGILKRTDRLPEARSRRRDRERKRRDGPVERIAISKYCELRRIDGIWYEILLAPLPRPEYEREVSAGRLITPGVIDVVTGRAIPAGPQIDEEGAWRAYRRDYPDRRYAVSKRQISRKELRRHGLANTANDP